MAANKIQTVPGTPIVWADDTDFSGTANGFTKTHQLDLTSVASSEAREGAKADLTVLMAPEYAVRMCLEYAVAPVAGKIAQVGFAWSQSGTAGTGNDAGATGADADYKLASEVEWFAQLQSDCVNMPLTADATGVIQFATLGILTPKSQHVSPIFHNLGGQAIHSDAVEKFNALIPLTPTIE